MSQLLVFPVTDFCTKFPVTDLFSLSRSHTVLGHMVTGCCRALANLSRNITGHPTLPQVIHSTGVISWSLLLIFKYTNIVQKYLTDQV